MGGGVRTADPLADRLPSTCRARHGVVARVAGIGRRSGRSGSGPGARVAAAASPVGAADPGRERFCGANTDTSCGRRWGEVAMT